MRSLFVKEKERLFKKCLFRRQKQRFGWLLLVAVGGGWGALLRGVYHVFLFSFIFSFSERQ